VIIPIVAIVLIFGFPFVWLVLHYCHSTAKVFFETRLKRDMVARGFSAQEIVQVIDGRPAKATLYEAHGIPPAKPVRQPAVHSN
jgi:hypothetical protein